MNRLLIERHPDILVNATVPLNYYFSELYTSIQLGDDGQVTSTFNDNIDNVIEVKAYKTKKHRIEKVFYKPITKNFNIKQKKTIDGI
jgi:hypothetical protein